MDDLLKQRQRIRTYKRLKHKTRPGDPFQERPGYCEWNADPTEKDPDARPRFSCYEGSVETKNPGAPTIRKMMQIATTPGAKVQGDDGEFYNEDLFAKMEDLEEQRQSSKYQESKPWGSFGEMSRTRASRNIGC